MLVLLRLVSGVLFAALLISSVACLSFSDVNGHGGLSRRLTNAERMARGLPLNKPVMRRTNRLRGLPSIIVGDSSTLASAASTATTSSTPVSDSGVATSSSPVSSDSGTSSSSSVTTSSSSSASATSTVDSSPTPCPTMGHIRVSGHSQGYIGTSNAQGYVYVVSSVADAEVFIVDTCLYPGPLIDVSCQPGGCNQGYASGISGATALGGVVAVGTADLVPNATNNVIYLSAVPHVAAGGPTNVSQGYPLYAESMIWIYDPTTGSLTPQWTNTNGDAVSPTYLEVTPGGIHLDADNASAAAILLFFEPLITTP